MNNDLKFKKLFQNDNYLRLAWTTATVKSVTFKYFRYFMKIYEKLREDKDQ